MSRFLAVNNATGIVENLIEAEPGFTLTGFTLVAPTGTATIGWAYANGGFTAPAPPQAPVPASISRRQFAQGLAHASMITQQEAIAFLGAGTIPSAMQALINTLPSAQQFDATMEFIGASEFNRSDPLVATMAAAYGWTADQTDQAWRDWSRY